jgi:hypothetical protein
MSELYFVKLETSFEMDQYLSPLDTINIESVHRELSIDCEQVPDDARDPDWPWWVS